MSTTLVCDNVYQLYVGWALCATRARPGKIDAVVSIGDGRLADRARDVAADSGWSHFHVNCPPGVLQQIARAAILAIRSPAGLRRVLERTRTLIIFNDTHPCTAQVRNQCPGATVSLVEEGTGLHRTRPVNPLSPRRWLSRLLVRNLNVSGRQGEAPWVDELWVTQNHALTPTQQHKRITTFDRKAVIAEMRRSFGTEARLPTDERPLLLLVGQPFVEDRVLTRHAFDSMLNAVSAALGPVAPGILRAYKPHPRERRPERAASRVLGTDVLILDQHTPLETMDFGTHRLLVLSFTSGAVRQLADQWRCVSVAGCFPALAQEIGNENTFPGVTFLRDLSQLSGEVAAFAEAA